jgi:hypothetical protein
MGLMGHLSGLYKLGLSFYHFSIFFLEFNMSFTHNPKDIVYSLFFTQGF